MLYAEQKKLNMLTMFSFVVFIILLDNLSLDKVLYTFSHHVPITSLS